jgi:hypothetical protein
MQNAAQSGARPRYLPFDRPAPLLISIAALIAQTLLLSGCSVLHRRPGIPWATAVQVRPTLPVSGVGATEVNVEAPELDLEMPPFAAILVPVRSAPPRPHVSASPPPTEVADPERAEAPTIVQQLSPEETTAAQQEMNQSLNAAEKKLVSARGRALNPAQADLISKIKGFLKDAREAAKVGDWARARSLARKAQVLSEELSL